jgi:hypothetical protein
MAARFLYDSSVLMKSEFRQWALADIIWEMHLMKTPQYVW